MFSMRAKKKQQKHSWNTSNNTRSEKQLHEYGCWTKNRGILPPKWMVKIMENPIKMDDLGGPPLYLETPICSSLVKVGPVFSKKSLGIGANQPARQMGGWTICYYHCQPKQCRIGRTSLTIAYRHTYHGISYICIYLHSYDFGCGPPNSDHQDYDMFFLRPGNSNKKNRLICHEESASWEGVLPGYPPKTFHYTGWLIGILIMAYYNPYITG